MITRAASVVAQQTCSYAVRQPAIDDKPPTPMCCITFVTADVHAQPVTTSGDEGLHHCAGEALLDAFDAYAQFVAVILVHCHGCASGSNVKG